MNELGRKDRDLPLVPTNLCEVIDISWIFSRLFLFIVNYTIVFFDGPFTLKVTRRSLAKLRQRKVITVNYIVFYTKHTQKTRNVRGISVFTYKT